MTIRKCADCGTLHPRLIYWRDAEQTEYCFCNTLCKRHFFEVTYPDLTEQRRLADEKSRSILPEVRVLTAHKDKKGRITFVRSDG